MLPIVIWSYKYHLYATLITISLKTLEPLRLISQCKYMYMYTTLQFTVINECKTFISSDLIEFYAFVERITTQSCVGHDVPEDVFGGLHAMLKLNWPAMGTKVCSNSMLPPRLHHN